MRILFVAMINSIHTARWLSQLANEKWDIHLFPVNEQAPHPGLRNVVLHAFIQRRYWELDSSVRQVGLWWPFRRGTTLLQRMLARLSPDLVARSARLARAIRHFRPDIVHSMEMQHASYLTLESRKILAGRPFPTWIYSSWGSDLFYFGRQPEHEGRIREVLAACDYYIADCQRDARLVRELGFEGEILGVLPAVGGLDIQSMRQFCQPGPVSSRKVIALKGYHDDNWAGRALVALQALQMCADSLAGYEIVVYLAGPNVRHAVEHVARITGLRFTVLPYGSYDEILKMMGRARIAIGVSVTDGTPITMLEAMVMGAFPIQSDTISTAEWVVDGENGLLVPPEDPEAIATAIRRALSDDTLVDKAAQINARMMEERIGRAVIQPQVIAAYEKVAAQAVAGR
jgi:glycosyltransferase involved in cell wall biosynthesis